MKTYHRQRVRYAGPTKCNNILRQFMRILCYKDNIENILIVDHGKAYGMKSKIMLFVQKIMYYMKTRAKSLLSPFFVSM